MNTLEPREHRVAHFSELAPAPSMRPFEIGETRGLLVRMDDGLHAVDGLCPHAKAPLHEGALCGHRLVCPWHQSVFDVRSGALLDPPALDGLKSFPVRVAGDAVLVTLPAPTPAPPARWGVQAGARTVLIAGAGAAGHVAAESLRAEGFDGRIVLVGPEPEPPYDRTNLSKHFLSGKARREELPLRTDPEFLARLGVERKTTRVTRLAAPDKLATFANGETLPYTAAVLATGATPARLEVPGADHPRVQVLRTLADAERIIALAPGKGSRAVAVGASFIGLEAVSSLAQCGVGVTVLSAGEVPFERQLGAEVGASIRRLHESHGVTFLPGAEVVRFEDAPGGLHVVLATGEVLPADVVIIGVGVRPAAEFVDGVERAPDGAIIVDDSLHAGHDLYAVGDLANFPLPATGERVRIEHWRVAQQHGALAGHNIARPDDRLTLGDRGFVPFFWTYHFEQRMNHVGFAREWDEVFLDGDPAAPPFIAYYLRAGRTVAAAGTHRDADLAALHELLRLGRAPSITRLRAGGYSPLDDAAVL